MEKLKKGIDKYMKLKSIKMYSHLLMKIAKELGFKGEDAYVFARKEKANFSKMLKGERPLKYEFIIPIEKIFGVSYAKIINENLYEFPIEKENVPIKKGFSYYAFLDDPNLYKNEFDKLSTKEGKSILNNSDEFGKTFLDYVVEYQAVNGVRYLHDEYGIKLKWYYNHFDFKKEKGGIYCGFENSVEFAKLVASMNDVDLFNDIYDSYNMFYQSGHYGGPDSLFCNPDYIEILLNNEKIFNSLFEEREYNLELGSNQKRKTGKDFLLYHSINPILNNCLKFAIKGIDKYKKQAIKILKFGIDHNKTIANHSDAEHFYICNELGAVKSTRDSSFYKCAIIVANDDVKDDETKELISKLPKFKRLY